MIVLLVLSFAACINKPHSALKNGFVYIYILIPFTQQLTINYRTQSSRMVCHGKTTSPPLIISYVATTSHCLGATSDRRGRLTVTFKQIVCSFHCRGFIGLAVFVDPYTNPTSRQRQSRYSKRNQPFWKSIKRYKRITDILLCGPNMEKTTCMTPFQSGVSQYIFEIV